MGQRAFWEKGVGIYLLVFIRACLTQVDLPEARWWEEKERPGRKRRTSKRKFIKKEEYGSGNRAKADGVACSEQ